MCRQPVTIRVGRNGFNPQLATRPDGATGDFSPVRDKYLLKQFCHSMPQLSSGSLKLFEEITN
jgi:hypothetical protein